MFEDREAARRERKEAKERARIEARLERRGVGVASIAVTEDESPPMDETEETIENLALTLKHSLKKSANKISQTTKSKVH